MDSNNNKKPWAYLIPSHFNLPIGKIMKTSFTIGRSITCDLILHDVFISHKHITIHKRSQGRGVQFTLVCHSKNKIYLNTTPITDSKNKMIKNNDQIWLVNRNVVSNCRTIGFLFKTENITQSSIVIQKFDRERASIQKFVEQVQLMMKCTRCNHLMLSPISLQPCSHKLCQNCAIWMIENLNDKCLVEGCGRKILTLMEDRSFSKIIKAYNRYRFGQDKSTPSYYFQQNPFLMQNWVKYNTNKNKHKSSNQRVKQIGTQKELSQNLYDQQTEQIHSSFPQQKHKNLSVNKSKLPSMPKIEWGKPCQGNNMKLEKQVQQRNRVVQGLQQLYVALAEMQRLKSENSIEELKSMHKDLEIESSRVESSIAQVKELKIADKIACWNCQKTVPFTLKNIENKQCKICLHQFCNKEFPPCKNLEEPLKNFSQRLIIISKEHVVGCLPQNLKTIVDNILMANIRKNSQISHVFQYILFKNGGFYTYCLSRDDEIKRIDINLSSCICDKCWPSIALQLLLSYLKIHQNKLSIFSRKNIEQTIAYVIEVKKQRK